VVPRTIHYVVCPFTHHQSHGLWPWFFTLVSPALANPETGFSGIQASYTTVLQQLTGVGTGLVNMTGVHQELLKHKASAT
jgi:hypothetical protein